MKKRIMLVGARQSGKSTLANWLNRTDAAIKNTQDVIYGCRTIDTPGAYLENARMYKYLIATAQAASHVLVLVDQSRPEEVYSPGFVRIFHCPVIGVITKCDTHQENCLKCVQQLQRSGVTAPVFRISMKTGTGLTSLETCLKSHAKGSE